MIGLDTNVLIRYLTGDDPIQSAKAAHLIERGLSVDEPGYISVVVMAEIAWVLEQSYGLTPIAIAAAIEALLRADNLIIAREQDVFTAMIALKDARASFADALIATLAASDGCDITMTFDRKATRFRGFQLL